MNEQFQVQLKCNHCKGDLCRSDSGIVCMDCGSKIIPTGEINDHYEGARPGDVANLPVNQCNSINVIANVMNRHAQLSKGGITYHKRKQIESTQDRTLKRMTLRRLKIENEQRRQRRMLFGDEPKDIEIQNTLF